MTYMEKISPFNAILDIWKVKRSKPEDILPRQQSRLADLISFARSNSRYYAQKYRELPEHITSLQQLPPVTKSELMTHFNDWATDPEVTIESVKEFVSDMSLIGHLYLGRYMVSTTSGSTGVPGIFIQDKGSDTVMKSLVAFRGMIKLKWSDMLKIVVKGGRNAAVCSTAGHFTAFSTAERLRLKRPSNGKIKVFSIHSPLSTLVKELNEYQPVVLGGYATVMEILAEEHKAGRLHIQPVAILLGGEKLYPNIRAKLESVFQARVLDMYGSTEATAMTFECEEGHFHVNTDWIIFEPVDEYYQPVPPGKQSHSVLITNLANRIQPLIRYELTDRVIMSLEPCKCGRPFPVIQVEGRTDDILKFSATNGQIVNILPLALKTIVEEIPGVKRFQLIQTASDQLTVRLEMDEGNSRDQVWENVREALLDYFATQGLITISIEKSNELPQRNPKSGKYQHIWIDYRE
ncbi:phenylacetate--CoA ligase family protein [Peribacillus sp. FSL M8-0224]|uniref:phenylacetate--CoA ligase family protein n=1 Tax=Peribacillus sp. FSL M8-0224 TaxID=2921568 RepID=UPI0030F5C9F8|nr:AMP-binding protein [Brevibacterium sp. PAMC21349]